MRGFLRVCFLTAVSCDSFDFRPFNFRRLDLPPPFFATGATCAAVATGGTVATGATGATGTTFSGGSGGDFWLSCESNSSECFPVSSFGILDSSVFFFF